MHTHADKSADEKSRAAANNLPKQRKAVRQAQRGANSSTVQLTEDGKWWGSVIGGALGGIAGAAAGYTYGALSATAGAITGGAADAVKGYQHEGISGALKWGAFGAATNAVAGYSSGMLQGGSVGMKLGSAVGSGIGDWWTGKDPAQQGHVNVIADRMRTNLAELTAAHPVLNPGIAGAQTPVPPGIGANEIKLLNWIFVALGPANFDEVANGGQVRVPFNQNVFNRLVGLGAQKRQSSHYSGTLFASGFTMVVGEQYGTTGVYLPTVLFGKIMDRKERPYMYFQPERNPFNPNTGWGVKFQHAKDAFNYAVYGVQQGPHGTSTRTDADPITGSGKYKPTISDKFGYARAGDFEAFAANLFYTSGGSALLEGIGVSSNEYRVAASHIITTAGLYGAAYAAWKMYNG